MFVELKKGIFRYERKFRVEELIKEEIERIVKINGGHFREIFYPRIVNSIYLDTQYLSSYFGNLAGISDKVKIRIRWYNSTFGLIKNPVLEIKLRKGFLSVKKGYELKNFKIDKKFSLKKIKQLILESEVPELVKEEIKSRRFSLFNSYIRRYFLSADKKFRLTIDYGVRFIDLKKDNNHFLRRLDDGAFIVELKYDQKYDNEVRKITTEFPFRMTKNSKYVIGVEKLNGII